MHGYIHACVDEYNILFNRKTFKYMFDAICQSPFPLAINVFFATLEYCFWFMLYYYLFSLDFCLLLFCRSIRIVVVIITSVAQQLLLRRTTRYMHRFIHMQEGMHVRGRSCIRMHTLYIHTYIHSFIHTFIRFFFLAECLPLFLEGLRIRRR